jgi:predicted DNA-binding transcriptional regulator AlpA
MQKPPLLYPPPWMDAKTLAQHLSVKPSTIRLMMKRGRLPRPMQDGKVTLWNWELVNRWLMRGDGSETTAAEVTADVLAKRARRIRVSFHRKEPPYDRSIIRQADVE